MRQTTWRRRRSLLIRAALILVVAASVGGTMVATSHSERQPTSLGEVDNPFLLIRVKRLRLPEGVYSRVHVSSAVNYLDPAGETKELLDVPTTLSAGIAPQIVAGRLIDVSGDEEMKSRATMAVSRAVAGNGRFVDVNLSVKYDGLVGDIPSLYEVKDMVRLEDLKPHRPITRTFVIKPQAGSGFATKLTVEYVRVAK